MAYGVKGLRKIQFGRETTAGTIAAATTIWRGEGTIEDTRVKEFPTEDVGYIPELTRSYEPLLGAQLNLIPTPATYEQIAHIFEMGIMTTAGVRDTTGSSDYIYTYPMATTVARFTTPTSSAFPIKPYSIEGGDNNEAEVMEFSYAEDFELAFKAGESLMVSATIKGRQVALQAFTGSVSAPTVFEILGSKCKLYIDAVGGTLGATQITNELLSASLKVKTGMVAIPTADGSVYFSFIKATKPEVMLELVFEHSTFAKAEKVFWRAGTPRQFQLNFTGPALSAVGSTYTTKKLICNLAGTYEKFDALADQDGDDIITATVRGGYNATAALFASFIVANELSTVP